MRNDPRRLSYADPETSEGIPPYLIYFGIAPFLAAFGVSAVDPLAGLALLACFAVMVIVVNLVVRKQKGRKEE